LKPAIEYSLNQRHAELHLRLAANTLAEDHQSACAFQEFIEELLRSDVGRSEAWNTLGLDLSRISSISCRDIVVLTSLGRRLAERPARLKLVMSRLNARRVARFARLDCLVEFVVAENGERQGTECNC
jgi:hypothetical protein